MNACCWQQEGHNLENAFSRQAKMAALQIVQTNLCILILGYTILFLTFYYLLGGYYVFVYVWKYYTKTNFDIMSNLDQS